MLYIIELTNDAHEKTMVKNEIKYVEIDRVNGDYNHLKETSPRTFAKLRRLEKKLNVCREAGLDARDCLSHAFFAVFGMLASDLEIEVTQYNSNSICVSVIFTVASIDSAELFINFKKL